VTKQESATLASLADELGDLEKDLAPWKAKASRAEALRASLRAAHRSSPARSIFRIEGKRWVVVLGPAANESRVDVKGLFKKIPLARFLTIANVTLAGLKLYVDPATVASVVSVEQTGPRPLTLTPVN
jgi:hypothetical protein